MRKTLAFILCILMIAGTLTACGNIPGGNLSRLQITENDNSLVFEVKNNQVLLTGNFENDIHNYVMIKIGNDENKKVYPVVEGMVECVAEIPEGTDEYEVQLYAGKEEYGYYESIIIDFLRIKKDGNKWNIVKSPVFENNKTVFESEKNKEDYLEATDKIQSDDPQIAALAKEIVGGAENDYERVKAIHDWVAENIYYDYDALANGNYSEMDAKSVLTYKKGVCEGYANITAALIRSLGIPCRIQSGYALGLGVEKIWTDSAVNTEESNHAWNEVYVDGRWIIIDATWDSDNKYINGRYEIGSFVRDIYFDSTLEFISLSHKFI